MVRAFPFDRMVLEFFDFHRHNRMSKPDRIEPRKSEEDTDPRQTALVDPRMSDTAPWAPPPHLWNPLPYLNDFAVVYHASEAMR